jgi:mRNA interferase MazF
VKNVYPFEVQVDINGKQGKVLLDQVRALDKQRLSNKITRLSQDTMALVDKALKISLGLK